ncbi:MAG: tRNA guanosine(34) transglycosylase Tgt [Chloroflexales bacterium]|nr:tRNA guanosine(34) transglycosylase Tgt [Chloroflexales bacterium]
MTSIFTITARDPESRARAGVIQTTHGAVHTPVFMPVGTRASVKSLSPAEVRDHGAEIILGNTYHLYLQPGHDLIARRGGLHRFMAWDGPILTDSGGFQVFSLVYGGIADEVKGRRPAHPETRPDMVKVTEDAVLFRSYVDGSRHVFTPERSIEIQHALGADIILCFDELPPFRASYDYTAQSLNRTHRWAERCLASHHARDTAQLPNAQQYLFGIVHGGVFADLRKASAEFIRALPFDGLCIGGSLGADKPQMYEVVDMTVPHLPDGLARHLLGVGDVDDMLECVARGIDMFDCVIPTRLGRHGAALVRDPARNWKLNVSNAALREDDGPLQEGCTCATCQTFSRAYIHYLFRVKELLGIRLISLHNVAFLHNLMAEMRSSIAEGCFGELYKEWLGKPLDANQ